VAQLHAACAKVAGVDTQPRLEAARLGDVQRSVLDVALIERELGWRAEVSLDDGLRRTWTWMQSGT
jgi:UDP-glucose 4-epimerase